MSDANAVNEGKYTLPMDFGGALKALREQLCVMRCAWEGDQVFLILDKKRIVEVDNQMNVKRSWMPIHDDLLATDWTLVTHAEGSNER